MKDESDTFVPPKKPAASKPKPKEEVKAAPKATAGAKPSAN